MIQRNLAMSDYDRANARHALKAAHAGLLGVYADLRKCGRDGIASEAMRAADHIQYLAKILDRNRVI